MVYKLQIKFKKDIGNDLNIDFETDEDIKEIIANSYSRKKNPFHRNVIVLGEHYISSEDILWIHIEGDRKVEESAR